MKICVACSAGGHLTEVMQLKEAFERYDHFFVTYDNPDSKELSKKRKVYLVTDPMRNMVKLVKNFFQVVGILLKEKPDVVITTGAGIAIPLCYVAKAMGKRIVYIESFCRVDKKSVTGRILYPIADVFLIQWKELLGKYGDKAKYIGGVF
jgi:beta-1,4-N-acetylglucosaminyltransferase